MVIIGITGPTGAGKSLFSAYLSQQNIPVIDADEVYHSLLIPPSPCLDALRHAFGEEILHPDGSLNRPALSQIVFHDNDKLSLLNRTVLGFVLDEIREQIRILERAGGHVVAVDAPTLIESGFHRECSTVISVLCPPEQRLERIIQRDGITREAAEARIHAQKEDAFYRAHSSHLLINDGDQDAFHRACDDLMAQLPLAKS